MLEAGSSEIAGDIMEPSGVVDIEEETRCGLECKLILYILQ